MTIAQQQQQQQLDNYRAPVLPFPNDGIFTSRDLTILVMTAQGYTYDAIAPHFNVSNNMIKLIMQNLLDVLGVPNKTTAVIKALQLGLISLAEIECLSRFGKPANDSNNNKLLS